MAKIICIEGIDGSGKTTACKKIKDILTERGVQAAYFHEPGSTHFGDKVYNLFKEAGKSLVSEDTKMLLVNTSRFELFKVINDLHRKHKNMVILLDRFIPSTLVYQGLYCRKFSLDDIYNLSMKCAHFIVPDYTFILDISVEICRDRLRQEAKDLDLLTDTKCLKLIDEYRRIADFLRMHGWNINLIKNHLNPETDILKEIGF